MSLVDQSSYWNRVANEITFTHPVNIPLLEQLVDKNACIIDYGCGYGRIVQELNLTGFTNVKGFDISTELVKRGNMNGVSNIYHAELPSGLPCADNAVDCFILFAVLTCIPQNQLQTEVIQTLLAKLKPNGVIYVSDYYLQDNSMEMSHYEYLNGDPENFGVFSLPEGATFRHHTHHWIQQLFKDFDIQNETLVDVKTMNGHVAQAFQFFAVKKS